MPPQPPDKLTIKEKKFVKAYGESGSQIDAALEAYACKDRKSASVMAVEVMKRPRVQREIERVMDEQGLTESKLFQVLKEGLEAKHISDYKGDAYETEIPDHKVRHRFLETAGKWKGLEAPKQVEQKSLSVNIEASIEAMSLEELSRAVLNQLKLLKNAENYGTSSVRKAEVS